MRPPITISSNHIIDCHTHCGGVLIGNIITKSYPYAQDSLDLIRKMKVNGVDYSICFPFPISSSFSGFNNIITPQLYNTLLLNEVEHFGNGCLLPFVYLRIDDNIDEQIDEIERLAERHIIYGLKIYPPSDKFSILDKKVKIKLESFITRNNFPIIFHTSFSGFGNANQILDFAEDNPNINISLAHAARFDKLAFNRISKLENVFMDISPLNMLCALMYSHGESQYCAFSRKMFLNPMNIMQILMELYPTKIMWGTDTPCSFLTNFRSSEIVSFNNMYTYENSIKNIELLDGKNKSLICNRNIINFMSLQNT